MRDNRLERVALLGPVGTNGHEVARRMLGIQDENIIFCNSNGNILEACLKGHLIGIVPIENSSAGVVPEVIDFWRQNVGTRLPISVVGEVKIPIEHCLLVHPSCTDLASIKAVKSHPQALEQCSKIIGAHQWQPLPALSTAAAAKEIMASASPDIAAIASSFAASVYGLNIIRRNIHNYSANETKFHIIGSKAGKMTGNDKTAIIFELKDVPGALGKVGTAFGLCDLNLSAIISIPTGKLGVYMFYIEFDCHQESPDGIQILSLMDRLCEWILVLGSYPQA